MLYEEETSFMRIATWNVNSLNARLPRLGPWLEETTPDVLCIQETKLKEESFPYLELEQMGYEAAHFGQGQWNGVAILSKVGISDVVVGCGVTYGAIEEARVITARCGGIGIVCAYVPNGRALDNDHYKYKLEFLAGLRSHIANLFSPNDDLVVAGDFNVAPTSLDVWSERALEGSTHVSQPEREALSNLCDWGLTDSLRSIYKQDGIYSWWDHRGGAFHKRQGMRIDFLLVSKSIENRLRWVLIDRNARKGEKPSDHAPVIIEF